VRLIVAAIICSMSSSPLLADNLILRCDAPQGGVSFSVSIDPTAHSVHSLGFATKVETDQFSDTVIAASSKDSESPPSRLMIDRITGQFQLSWTARMERTKAVATRGIAPPHVGFFRTARKTKIK
jgi:hypothetical protein